MSKMHMVSVITELADQWYTEPSAGMQRIKFRRKSLQRWAVREMCSYILRQPFDPQTPEEELDVIDNFGNMMIQGLKMSHSDSAKYKFKVAMAVTSDMSDVFRGAYE